VADHILKEPSMFSTNYLPPSVCKPNPICSETTESRFLYYYISHAYRIVCLSDCEEQMLSSNNKHMYSFTSSTDRHGYLTDLICPALRLITAPWQFPQLPMNALVFGQDVQLFFSLHFTTRIHAERIPKSIASYIFLSSTRRGSRTQSDSVICSYYAHASDCPKPNIFPAPTDVDVHK
jgi:hypothetical protein